MRERLRLLAQVVFKHHKVIFFIALAFTFWGIYLTAFKLGVMNDTNALIKQDSPAMKNFQAYVKEFDAADPIVVMIQSPDFDKNRQVVEAMAQQVAKRSNEIKKIYYKNDLSKLKPHFLLYESENELQDIIKQIRAQQDVLKGKGTQGVSLNSLLDQAIQQFDKVEKERGGGNSLNELGSFVDKMIKNLEKLAHDLKQSPTVPEIKATAQRSEIEELNRQVELNTYLSFEDGKMVLMMLTPGEGEKDSFSPQEKTIEHLRDDIAEIKKQFPDVNVGLTGEPVLLDDELKQSTKDMTVASLITFAFISILFIAAYRDIIRPSLGVLALTCAIFWSLGFTVLSVHHLNIISQAFVLMLLGIGIDFGIQIMGRYEEERAKGRPTLEALENSLQFTGLAVLTSGGITAIAFYTMCFNDFIGLQELGIIAGTGMLFCMATNLILLPSLLAWYDTAKKRPLPKHQQSQAEFGKKLDSSLLASPRMTLALMTVLTILAVLVLPKHKGFNHNLLDLQNPKIESVRLVKQMLSSQANSFVFGVIIADNMEDAKAKTEALEKLPSVRSVMSPTKILPEDQEKKLVLLKDLRAELNKLKFNPDTSGKVDVAKAKKLLAQILDDSRKGYEEAKKFRNAKDPRAMQAFKIFDRLLPALEKSVDALNSLPTEEAEKRLGGFQQDLFKEMGQQFAFLKSFDMENPVTMADLPPEALQHYLSPNGKVLLEVYPKENIWEREPNELFVRDLRSIDTNATGTPVQNYVYIEILKKAYFQAALFAFGAIIIVVGLYFRRLDKLILTLLPLGIAILWTLGCMSVFHIQFNPANIITLPLVIGIGVAYGIYIVDRHLEEGRVKLFGGSTGKALLLSALATICGFGTMMLGYDRGMFSLGLLMSIGIGFCFMVSILTLPQILFLLDEIKNRRAQKDKAIIKTPAKPPTP